MRAGIAGAGITGQLLALALSDAGWQVSIFDQGRENSCSMAAAGLLVPLHLIFIRLSLCASATKTSQNLQIKNLRHQ